MTDYVYIDNCIIYMWLLLISPLLLYSVNGQSHTLSIIHSVHYLCLKITDTGDSTGENHCSIVLISFIINARIPIVFYYPYFIPLFFLNTIILLIYEHIGYEM